MNEVKSPKKPLLYYYFVAMMLVMLFNFIAMPWISEHQIKDVDYNTFVTMTEQGEVGRVEIQEQSNRILFTSSDEKTVYKTAMVPDDGLVQRLLDAGVSTTGEEIEQTSTLVSILAWVLPIIIFVALGQYMSRKMMEKMGGGNSMMFNMGKSNAKVYVKSAEGIRFSDVAGEDEAKENLTEVVNYLHDPSKYQEIGASMPKGILLVGPPGTGKTMLAQAVADALGKKLIIWNVKSTTKAQDGLYVYDVVQRLYDSQFGNAGVDDVKKYIKLGKLGEAFSADEQVVLLIDEIDKADLEFPNDLLWELDRMEFYIPETKETVQAKQRPIVIITSNAEKELPDAFLRRCVFHYIEFPEQEQMEAILRVHFGDLEEKLVKQSLAAFYWLRELRGIEKKPSTSELVDWIRALVAGGVDPARIEKKIPFAGVLLKKDKDLQTLRKVK